MKYTTTLFVSLFVIFVFMAVSGFLTLEPLLSDQTKPHDVKWDAKNIITTLIPGILGAGSLFLFSKQDLTLPYLRLRNVVSAVILIFYTCLAAWVVLYPYVIDPPAEDRVFYTDYAKSLILTVLPATLSAALIFLLPKNKI